MWTFLALLTQPASAAWTQHTVFNGSNAVRTIGVALDDSLLQPTLYYVEDVFNTVSQDKQLGYRYYDTAFTTRVLFDHDINDATQEGYLPSLTTGDGEASIWLSAKWYNSGTSEYNIEEVVLNRSTGSATMDQTLGDDYPNDEAKHSFVRLDEANQVLHSCFTHVTSGSGEDANANHRALGSAWASASLEEVGGNGNGGTQDHCAIAVLASGTRIIAYHDGSNVKLRFESTPGTALQTLTFSGSMGHTLNWPTLAVKTAGATETIHLAVVDTNSNTILYRNCSLGMLVNCQSNGQWSAPVTVENGNSGTPRHPQIAVDENGIAYVLYIDDINMGADRVRVSCGTNAANFSSLDGGIVDGTADEEALATKDATGPDNTGHALPQIVVSDVLDKVTVVYIQDSDTSGGFDWIGRSSTHATGCP